MPTKRFVWKDRDNAAVDLIQLAYHAPQFISQHALRLLSAIRSEVIVTDLREITLDDERDYWERVCALRALRCLPGEVYFPELIGPAEDDLLEYQRVIARGSIDPDKITDHLISNDMIDEIIAFAAWQPSNRDWLWKCLDQADPFIVCSIISQRFMIVMPQDMTVLLLHRLITLLEAHPHLLSLHLVNQIYRHIQADARARTFLNDHFDAIVEKCISAPPPKDSRHELPWSIPFEWSELKATIFQRRPDLEDKFHREEARIATARREREEFRRIDYSYKETDIWRELETLYEQANAGDAQAIRRLHQKIWDRKLSIPERAAATHFFAKQRDNPWLVERLAILVSWPGDTWEDFYSPIQYEAGHALFEIATPEAWEALVAAFLVNPTFTIQDSLSGWIEALTDMLSGATPVSPKSHSEIENRWFKALLKESQA